MPVKFLLFTTISCPFTLLPGMCLVILCRTRMKNRNRLTACWDGRHYTHSYICMRTVSQDPAGPTHSLSLATSPSLWEQVSCSWQIHLSSWQGLLSLFFWDHCVPLPLLSSLNQTQQICWFRDDGSVRKANNPEQWPAKLETRSRKLSHSRSWAKLADKHV